jgi:hypothetical protein
MHGRAFAPVLLGAAAELTTLRTEYAAQTFYRKIRAELELLNIFIFKEELR